MSDGARPVREGRVLVLRALGVGDLLTAVPALRELRTALPGREIVLAAPEPLAGLAGLVDAVDRLLPTEELTPAPWTGPPPEVAVNLHGRGPQSHEILRRLSPGRLVAFGREELGIPGPAWDDDEHEVRRWLRLVGTAFGASPGPPDLRIAVPDEQPPVRGAVVVHAGAAAPVRRWPDERFAAVARACALDGLPVVLTGSAEEVGRVRRVQRLAGLPVDTVLAGATSLTGLAALVAAARLVVSGDTGIAHLASAYRVPSVVLFGPTPPARWGPPADGPHTVVWHGTGTGDPSGPRVDPALEQIGVAEVLAAVRQRLGTGPVGQPSGVSAAVAPAPARPAPRVLGTAPAQASRR